MENEITEIRTAMSAQKKTQKDVAALLNIPASAVSNILTGKRQLKASELSKIKAFLGMNTDKVREIPVIGLGEVGRLNDAVLETTTHISVPISFAAEGSIAVTVSDDSINLSLSRGMYALVNPSDTELYDGTLYLIEVPKLGGLLRFYRSDPARFETSSSIIEQSALQIGRTSFTVIGVVTGALAHFDNIRKSD